MADDLPEPERALSLARAAVEGSLRPTRSQNSSKRDVP